METRARDLNVLWTADMSVGSPSLDEHNRQMFSQLAAVDRMILSSDAGELSAWLQSAMDRLEVLMQEEERELADAGYPELAFHRQLHGRARAKMQTTRGQLQKVRGPVMLEALVRETCAELRVWLMRHVQDADKLFLPYIDARYRGRNP